MNCARPPNIAAKGASASGELGVPHQPARFDATMKVAPANPASPRIDGAAIGCRTTRVPNPSIESRTPVSAIARRSSSVLISPSFRNGLRYTWNSRFARTETYRTTIFKGDTRVIDCHEQRPDLAH